MKRNRLFLIALSIVLFSVSTYAQREETVLGERGWGFSGIWGGYHHQYTSYGNSDEFNRGGFFGFEFGKSLNVGWGNYRVTDALTGKALKTSVLTLSGTPLNWVMHSCLTRLFTRWSILTLAAAK